MENHAVMDTRRVHLCSGSRDIVMLAGWEGESGPIMYLPVPIIRQETNDATIDAMGITLEEEVEVRPRNPDDTFDSD